MKHINLTRLKSLKEASSDAKMHLASVIKDCEVGRRPDGSLSKKQIANLEEAKRNASSAAEAYIKFKANSHIEDILKDAQKRCKARTIDIDDILRAVKRIDNYYDVPKKHMTGSSFDIDLHSADFPKAYMNKGKPESTHIYIVYKNGTPFLVDVFRSTCSNVTVKADLSADTKKALLDKFTGEIKYGF